MSDLLRTLVPKGMTGLTIEKAGDGLVNVRGHCRYCDQPQTVCVPRDGYLRYLKGDYVQDALGMLPMDQRELLVSGTCDECWQRIFGDDSDDKESVA